VAFAAAATLARLFPEASILWYGLALGCALTRVASGAHFMSDVVVAALVGYGATYILGLAARPAASSQVRGQEEIFKAEQ
jgi:membrane-associated phospholipid phosphatase